MIHGNERTLIAVMTAFAGGFLAASWLRRKQHKAEEDVIEGQQICEKLTAYRRSMLPKRIILVRHGESEGNADDTLYRTKADNQIELTEKGSQQACAVGQRIKTLVGPNVTFHTFVSPFQRTLQTCRNILAVLGSQNVHTYVDPRIREQEFGNLQNDNFEQFRTEQKNVGRFWYRFPTGESGADVFDRTKQWFEHSVCGINTRPGYEPVDTVLVVTHGLTMRLILMQLHGWSVTTFHTVWNAGNCAMYVLKKDENLPGLSPYALCPEEGDMPAASIALSVKFRNGNTKSVTLQDYLSIPQPRTRQFEAVRQKLAEQNPDLDAKEIVDIDFHAGGFVKYK
mmetsp:Transcript_1958/g.4569  ORF Transcript_1958/g.4569 Transcript_1958/m.4569 type:complete len:339 (+) Transcript_1958:153-1169(+)